MRVLSLINYKPKFSQVQGKILSGFFWSAVSSVISQAIGIINSIIIAKSLGLHLFGAYSLTINTVVTLGTLASLGLAITAAKFGAKYSQNKERLERFIAGCYQWACISALLLVLILIVIGYLKTNLLSSNISISVFIAAVCFIIPITLTSIQNNLITAFNGFRALASMNLMRATVTFVATFLLTRFFKIEGAIFASLLTFLLQFILFERYLQRFYKSRDLFPQKYFFSRSNLFDKINTKILKQFSIPSLLQNLLVIPVIWFINLWLAARNNGLENVGIFNAVFQWRNSLLLIPSILGQTLVPILSQNSNKGMLKESIVKNARLLAGLYVFPLLLLFFFRNFILDKYQIKDLFAGNFFTIILISVYIQAVTIPYGQFLTMINRIWVGFFMNLIWLVQLFLLLFLFEFFHCNALYSIGYSFLISYVTQLVIAFSYFKKRVDVV